MTEDQIIAAHQNTFEEIRHLDENGQEFWMARELAKVLGYARFRNFHPVLEKAVEAAQNAGHNYLDHLAEVRQMVSLVKGTL